MTLTRTIIPRKFTDQATGKRVYVTLPAQRALGPAKLAELIRGLGPFLKLLESPGARVHVRYGQLDVVIMKRRGVHEP